MSAGKGDKIRKGANLKAYRDNYDSIFRKKNTVDEIKYNYSECPDCMGFGEYVDPDYLTSEMCHRCKGRGTI